MDKSDREVFEQGIHIYKTLLLFQNRFMKEFDEYEKCLRRLVYAIDFTEVCEAMARFANTIGASSRDYPDISIVDEILRLRKDYKFYRPYGCEYSYVMPYDIHSLANSLNNKSSILKEYITGLLFYLFERYQLFYIPLSLAEKMLDLTTDQEIKELLGDQYFTNAKSKYISSTDEPSQLNVAKNVSNSPYTDELKWTVIIPYEEIQINWGINKEVYTPKITCVLADYFKSFPECFIMQDIIACWTNQYIPIDWGD